MFQARPQLTKNSNSNSNKSKSKSKSKCRQRLPIWILIGSFVMLMIAQVWLLRSMSSASTTSSSSSLESTSTSISNVKAKNVRNRRPSSHSHEKQKQKQKQTQNRNQKPDEHEEKQNQERNMKLLSPPTPTPTPTRNQFPNQFPNPPPNQSQLLYDAPPDLSLFPKWIRDYVTWHSEMRTQFPGMELWTNPRAPNVLIRTCLGLCGGLHDRLGQLPWDLYLANATGRVLLMAWQRPRSLENFLIPSNSAGDAGGAGGTGALLLDWTVPEEAQFGFDDIRRVRNHTELFEGYPEANPEDEFWKHDLDASITRATTGAFRNIKVLRHRLLGHLREDVLEERLRLAKMAEEKGPKGQGQGQEEIYHHDDNDVTVLHSAPLFGNIFWLFFRPSKVIDLQVRDIMKNLQLTPHAFSAVHCRVRHPKATAYSVNILGKNPKYPADKTGLPWVGETRQFALDVARQALQCAMDVSPPPPPLPPPLSSTSTTTSSLSLSLSSKIPIYFLSDSNDLVRHVVIELQDEAFVQANQTLIDQRLYQVVKNGNDNKDNHKKMVVVARDVTEETAHLDRQKGRPAEAYFSTFLDLMIAVHAQCVVYGIGYYAAFAAKISGIPCTYLYQEEAWGSQASKQARICPNHHEN